MRKAWSAALVLGLCGSMLAAGEATKDAAVRTAFQDFQMKWEQGRAQDCAAMFAPAGGGTVTLKEALTRRGVPEGQAARNNFQISFKTEGDKSTVKVRAQFLLTKEGAKEKQLLALEETFVVSMPGPTLLVTDYQRTDETAQFVKTLNEFIDGQLRELRDATLPVPQRQSSGGFACENMRALGQPRRAWPVMKEMFDLGTENVSDTNLRMFQGVLKELVQLETPPEEYRPVVDKIMAMKPKEGH